MQEIVDQGDIEEDALIQYIIDGIQDDECNKTMLYSARTLCELKKCLEVYDRIKEKTPHTKGKIITKKDGAKDNTTDAKSTRFKSGSKHLNKKCCFNCGSAEHDARSCTDADKGPKCFRCNDYGHIAPKCPQTKQQGTPVSAVNCVSSIDDKFILVDIAGLKCTLIDTGSDVSLLRNDWYEKIGRPKLCGTSRIFTGLGSAITRPSGTFLLKVSIGEDVYEVEAHVIPTDATDTELILGRDFLKIAEFTIRGGRTEIKRLRAEGDVVVNKNQLPMKIRQMNRRSQI